MSSFRKDINGLRAIAVIAVVLFHFKPAWLSGGFAGVDVFFVISGFLMTGIISRGIEQDNFSILKFYVARANRIIPALAVLCLALMVFGWFYLTPLDYKTLGKHAAGSIGFLSNVLYWRESGYFDASSLEKWLLHTWSLSVEWQFYIIYPLILISVRKLFSIQAIKPVVLLGTVLSFILCVYATYQWPTAAYYLLPTRAWEMMIGGVAYLYPISSSNRQKRVLELVGVVLIIGSYFTVSAETFWPGYIALFPVLGSFLIIVAQRNDSLITGNIVFQKIGLWSYSIYLWHWPLVVAIYSFSLDARYVYFGMFLSVLLGFLSYKYIERLKFSNDFKSLFEVVKFWPAFFVLLIALLGCSVFFSNGSPYRFSSEQQLVFSKITEQETRPSYDRACFDYTEVEPCTYLDGVSLTSSTPSHILFGDSHAQSAVNGIAMALSETKGFTGLKFYGMAGCFFTDNIDEIYPEMSNCGSLARKSIEEVIEKYPKASVIYINRLSSLIMGDNNGKEKSNIAINQAKLKNDFYKTLDKLSIGRNVYIVTPTPEFSKSVPGEVARRYLFGKSGGFKISVDEYDKRSELALDIILGIPDSYNVKVLDLKKYFCDEKYCYADDDLIPLYRDTNHMSEYGNKKLVPLFNEIN